MLSWSMVRQVLNQGGSVCLLVRRHVELDSVLCRHQPDGLTACCLAAQAIFEEFNTLSVVYQQPAALFVQSAQYQLQEDEAEQAQVRRPMVASASALTPLAPGRLS